MNLDIGTTLGDYQIIGVLGAGGMGKVYKVRNVISDRVEAMKVLLPNLDDNQELAERCELASTSEEARQLASETIPWLLISCGCSLAAAMTNRRREVGRGCLRLDVELAP